MTDPLHPASALDDRIHQKARLGILALSAEAKSVEFGYVQRTLNLTPGNLSRHLGVLEEASLISIEKGYVGKRPRSWISLTKTGRAALVSEIQMLRKIVNQVEANTAFDVDEARSEPT